MVIRKTKNLILLGLGWTCLALALVGIPLPILPTTPFLILSAYLFSKSSPKLHSWLLNQKYVGQIIKDWERDGVINKKSKFLAVLLILTLFICTLIFAKVHFVNKVLVGIILSCVIIFITSRPSTKQQLVHS